MTTLRIAAPSLQGGAVKSSGTMARWVQNKSRTLTQDSVTPQMLVIGGEFSSASDL